ncbi:MAG: hypothetical protein AAF754_02745 [Pseudomonadota bacterium]
MKTVRAYLLGGLLIAIAGPLAAITPEACKRTTHISHGGEIFHRDLGEGRVIWLDWWGQEGTYHELVLVECASGETLRFRTHEHNIAGTREYHRTERAWDVVQEAHEGSRVFATLPRIAEAVKEARVAENIALTTTQIETCACAAFYPDQRGEKTAFEFEVLK